MKNQRIFFYIGLLVFSVILGFVYIDANLHLELFRPLISASIALGLISILGIISYAGSPEFGAAKGYPVILFFVVLVLGGGYLLFPSTSQSILAFYLQLYAIAAFFLVLATADRFLPVGGDALPSGIYTTKAPYAIPPSALPFLLAGVALATFGLIIFIRQPLLGYPTFGVGTVSSLISGLIGEAENIVFIFAPFWILKKMYTVAGIGSNEAGIIAGASSVILFVVMHSRVYGGNVPALFLVGFFASVAIVSYILTGSIFIASIIHFMNNFTASLLSLKAFAIFPTATSTVVKASFDPMPLFAVFGIMYIRFILGSVADMRRRSEK